MPIKVLFVCYANICRSPIAQGVGQHLAYKKGLAQYFIFDSAGTSSHHTGHNPDPRSITVANKHYIDISCQQSRAVKDNDFIEFDYLLAMDNSNFDTLVYRAPSQYRHKIHLLLEYFPTSEYTQIPDPYFFTSGFELIYELISQATSQFIDQIIINK
jgi:protein-tyrosine phosphatase